jgi:molybdopterin converting factor small subunit
VRVVLPSQLLEFSAGEDVVELAGGARTVRQALDALWRAHPGLRDRVLLATGEIRPHVNVFVGPDSVRHLLGLETPVSASTEITILPSVSGG